MAVTYLYPTGGRTWADLLYCLPKSLQLLAAVANRKKNIIRF